MISAPEPLTREHQLDEFDCGVLAMNDWLWRRALGNQQLGATRTFVISEGKRVVGYYSLAAGSVSQAISIGRFRRNMPDPVPVVVLARLAVDRTQQGRGLGGRLLRNAALRVVNVSEEIGIRGMLVHAISADATAFYQSFGFAESRVEPRTLMMTLGDIETALRRT